MKKEKEDKEREAEIEGIEEWRIVIAMQSYIGKCSHFCSYTNALQSIIKVV